MQATRRGGYAYVRHGILRHFKERGASFLKQPDVLQRQLFNVKALLFDWDGVFNEGFKGRAGRQSVQRGWTAWA